MNTHPHLKFLLGIVFVLTFPTFVQAQTPILISPDPTLTPATTQDITLNNGLGTVPLGYGSAPSQNGAGATFEPISINDQYASQATDLNTNPDPRVVNGTPVDALGYVNTGDVPDKSWDLEAFGYQSSPATLSAPATSLLTYVGGFNPLTANEGFSLGDIFLSTQAVPQTQPAGNGNATNTGNNPYPNPGYTYAIHITGVNLGNATLSYEILSLTPGTSVLQTVSFNNFENNALSNPYAVDLAGGGYTVLAQGTAQVYADTNTAVNSLLQESLFNTPGDEVSPLADNYAVTFNLSSTGLTSFNAQLTEQCGNDLLAGSTSALNFSAAPEPKSFYLGLLAGGIFLFALRSSRRKLLA